METMIREREVMSNKERGFITTVLAIVVVMVGIDLATDLSQGARWWHIAIEGGIALTALSGIYFLLRGSIALKHSLAEEKKLSSQLQAVSAKWRSQSRRYIDGLSQTIDAQLTSWKLTSSEKEVAFLLLKGLSLKEVAETRKTTEKTARTQSISIYSKAGLAGRSELAAFFLEDLLPPVRGDEVSEPKAIHPE